MREAPYRLVDWLIVPIAAWALGACGTEAMGTDACRKIEQARCRKAPACAVLGVRAGTGVEECTQFARDRCLHGLPVADPGGASVDKCVTAIDQASSCDTVVDPSTAPSCAFLVTVPMSVDDAGASADAGTAADGDNGG